MMWRTLAEPFVEALQSTTPEGEMPTAMHLFGANQDEQNVRVCYVMRRPSYIEVALLQSLAQRQQLPVPNQILPGNTQALHSGAPCVLFMRDRLGSELFPFRRRQWRKRVLEVLSSVLEHSSVPVLFIPVSFFAGRGPQPIPGAFRWPLDFSLLPLADAWRVVLLHYHKQALSCLLGRAVHVRQNDTALRLSKVLSRELYRQEKLVRGARSQPSERIEEIVLESDAVVEAMQQFAEQESCSLPEARVAARKRFYEMAAAIKGWVIAFFAWLLIPIIQTVFSRIQVRGIEEVRSALRKTPIVLLPSHRSHFDYILLSYVLYVHKLPLPYVAAGINLNFWPFGPLARSAGGFFIRRSIGKDFLYRAVLDGYLRYLSKRGHMLEFFIEGGRSRSGAMRHPRLGLLKYLLEGWKSGERDDLQLFPIGITYEKLVEEKALYQERSGKRKVGESLRGLLQLWNIRHKRFGSVVVEFDAPLSLRDFFSNEKDIRRSWSEETEDLAYDIARKIEERTALTNTALAASIVLAVDSQEVGINDALRCQSELFSAIGFGCCSDLVGVSPRDFLQWCARQNVPVSEGLHETCMTQSSVRTTSSLLLHLVSQELATLFDGSELLLRCTAEQRAKLVYYKNNSMHLFLPAALVGIAGSLPKAFRSNALYRLQQLCKSGFLLPLWNEWRSDISQCLHFASTMKWIEPISELYMHPDGTHADVSVTPAGRAHLTAALVLFRPHLVAVCACLEVISATKSSQMRMEELRVGVEQYFHSGKYGQEVLSSPLLEFALQCAVQYGFLEPLSKKEEAYRVVSGIQAQVIDELQFCRASVACCERF